MIVPLFVEKEWNSPIAIICNAKVTPVGEMAVGACTCLRGLRRENGAFIPNVTITKRVTPTSNIAVQTSVALVKME